MDEPIPEIISLEDTSSSWLKKTTKTVSDFAKRNLHNWDLRNAAISVKRLSGNETDMSRLAATFKDELVHKKVYDALLTAFKDNLERLDILREKLKKKSARVVEQNKQIKKLKANVRDLKESTVSQDALIEHLLAQLGTTREELEKDLLATQLASLTDKRDIQSELDQTEQKLHNMENLLSAVRKK